MENMRSLSGKRFDAQSPTRVFLHRGINIAVAGEHLEGGRIHTVPFHVATDLFDSRRAHRPTEEEEAAAADLVGTQPQSRDPEPVSNDARPKRTR
jgi:hypothetical protein